MASFIPQPGAPSQAQEVPEEGFFNWLTGALWQAVPPELRGKAAGVAQAPGWLAENVSNAASHRDYAKHMQGGEYWKLPMDFIGGIPGLGTAAVAGAKGIAKGSELLAEHGPSLGTIFAGIPTLERLGLYSTQLHKTEDALKRMTGKERREAYLHDPIYKDQWVGPDNKLRMTIPPVQESPSGKIRETYLQRLDPAEEKYALGPAFDKKGAGAFNYVNPYAGSMTDVLDVPPMVIAPGAKRIGITDQNTGQVILRGDPANPRGAIDPSLPREAQTVPAAVTEMQRLVSRDSGLTPGMSYLASPYSEYFWRLIGREGEEAFDPKSIAGMREKLIADVQAGIMSPERQVAEMLEKSNVGENIARAGTAMFTHWPQFTKTYPMDIPFMPNESRMYLTEDILGKNFEKFYGKDYHKGRPYGEPR